MEASALHDFVFARFIEVFIAVETVQFTDAKIKRKLRKMNARERHIYSNTYTCICANSWHYHIAQGVPCALDTMNDMRLLNYVTFATLMFYVFHLSTSIDRAKIQYRTFDAFIASLRNESLRVLQSPIFPHPIPTDSNVNLDIRTAQRVAPFATDGNFLTATDLVFNVYMLHR